MVADFEMEMTTSNPTFQRVAISKSLQQLAPKAYINSTAARDMVLFIKKVQKRWRFFTSTLKEGGYEPFDTKKFGYARNCAPVLVSTTCNNGQLIPCRMFMCPFCWSRLVVIRACELLEPYRNEIERWRWGHVDFGGGFNHRPTGDFDDYDTNLSAAVKAAHGSMPAHEGDISYTYVWGNPDSETPSFSGRVQYLALTSGSGSSCADGNPTIHQASNPFVLAKDAAKAVGQAFAYPTHIMPPKASKSEVFDSVYWWNQIRHTNFRAFRTSGVFYGDGKSRTRKRKEDKFNDVYRRLEALERKLGVEPDERKDNE